MFTKKKYVVLELTSAELLMIRNSLIDLRNRLIAAGSYTDAVDEMLIKLA